MSKKTPQCGILGVYPRIFQGLVHPATFLVFYSLVGVMQGAYYTYLVGITNTLEKRFAIRSQISSMMNMADNIAPILFGAAIGHWASKGHRPRWTAFAMFTSSLACVLGALSYFLYGPGNDYYDDVNKVYIDSAEDDIEFCAWDPGETRLNQSACDNSKKLTNVPSVAMLFSSNFLTGIVTAIYYSAGTAYLDDNVRREHSPMYMTISAFLRGLGPALGFVLSSACLYLYEDPSHPPDYGPNDPRWIGAWWLGFVILAVIQCVFTVPLLMFPKRMKTPDIAVTVTFNQSGMRGAFMRLLRNPIYMFNMFSEICKWFGLCGHFNFLQKYLQEQFHVSASSASLYGGSMPITVSLLVAFLGGVAIRYWKPNPRLLTLMMFTAELITVILMISLMKFKCETPTYATNYGASKTSVESMKLSCNSNCHCSLKVFHPVCINGTTFFSPCFAGCPPQTEPTDSTKAYLNCTCAEYSTFENTATTMNRLRDDSTLMAFGGHCNKPADECDSQYRQYLFILTLSYCVTFVFQTAHILIPMRCVDLQDKTFSLAIMQVSAALFAFIPYPLVFSYLVDSTCVLWEESCLSKGNCWVYNIERFNQTLHLTAAFFYLLGALCFFFVFILSGSKRLAYFYNEENEIKTINSSPK